VNNHLTILQASRRDGQIRRKFSAVRTHGRHFDATSEHRAVAGFKKCSQPAPMRLAQTLGDERVGHGLAQHLVAAITEELLSRGIEIDDPPILVHRDDGIECRFQNGTLACLALAQIIGEPLEAVRVTCAQHEKGSQQPRPQHAGGEHRPTLPPAVLCEIGGRRRRLHDITAGREIEVAHIGCIRRGRKIVVERPRRGGIEEPEPES
jgi:hypothetical protein